MENTVVVYESRYGSTKKYAQWIAQDLGCTLIETKDVTVEKLQTFDTIIYGGWLHAGSIKGFKVISKDIDKLKDKNIVVFSVGCSTLSSSFIFFNLIFNIFIITLSIIFKF